MIGTLLENVVSGSNFGILNWDSPTRLQGNANPSSPDVSLASASLIISTNWQTKTNLGSDHLPILLNLQMAHTINPIPHRTSFNLKKANRDRYRREIEDKRAKDGFHQTAKKEKLSCVRNTWRQFVETLDHRTDPSKLWRTIKAIDGKSPPKAENEAITFDDTQVSSPKQIANYFNRQFTTSMLGRHISSRETRIVSREIKRTSLMPAVTFTTDQVIKGISNCDNTKAFGPDKLSIFHLKNLGLRAI